MHNRPPRAGLARCALRAARREARPGKRPYGSSLGAARSGAKRGTDAERMGASLRPPYPPAGRASRGSGDSERSVWSRRARGEGGGMSLRLDDPRPSPKCGRPPHEK
eukprot:scaffold1594_cov401-Prasinococcus_capsulatus_cf.AAC.36